MKLLLSSIAAIAAATAALGFNEIVVSSGLLYVPDSNGVFTTESVGTNALFFACTVDEATYLRYADDSAGLYQAYGDGEFANAEEQIIKKTKTEGYYRGTLVDGFPADTYYVVMVATYASTADGKDYYIAKAASGVYTDEAEENFADLLFSLDPTGWSYVSEEPPAPLVIECTGIAVSGGTVTVTYQVSDLSGFAVGSTVNFSVAYSLARNASGELATETLSGTINSIDATASTFTATLSPPANTTSLFILGIDD